MFRKLKADMEKERQHEEHRERQRHEEREKLRQQQLQDRAAREKAEIQQMNVSQEEKARLMAEHEANIAKLEENLKKVNIVTFIC